MSDEIRALGTGAKCCGTCGCLDGIEVTPAVLAPAPTPSAPQSDEEEPAS